MGYRCWAEVDLSALSENLAWIRHRIHSFTTPNDPEPLPPGSQPANESPTKHRAAPSPLPRKRVITVVKADAYGHGLKEIAARLMQSGTDIFGVANLAEARIIQRVGQGWPVLLLGSCLPHEIETAVRDGVMVTISSLPEAQRFSEMATRLKQMARIHLKADTGMGRLGVPHQQAGQVLQAIRRLPGLEVAGLCTHYAAAEDDPAETRLQAGRFHDLVASLGRDLPGMIHVNNSGGVLWEEGTTYNAVRPGLLVYGILPLGNRPPPPGVTQALRPALSWKCRVGLVKEIEKGTRLSYGGQFAAPRPMRVATITAGYGDGYMRAGSDRARVLIGGRRCPVLGRVTMDQMLVDVTGVDVVEGDEVVLIGRQAGEELTVPQLAEMFGTVSWEVLTNISHRVPRIYRGTQAS